MTYDKSGNITRLTRWDNQDAMNILWYTYDSVGCIAQRMDITGYEAFECLFRNAFQKMYTQ